MSDRLNRAPIFLNCFSRGGSNILWNIFLSHPDCCSPLRETIEIFHLGWRRPTWTGLKTALLCRQLRFFDQWFLGARKMIGQRARAQIDQVFYNCKLETINDPEMRLKRPEETYTLREIERARLVAKNNNGLAFLAPQIRRIYPDCTFVALIRDPVALYESHQRRGITSNPKSFCDLFNRIGLQMANDAREMRSYWVVWFDQILESPLQAVQALHRRAGLDSEVVEHLRFKSKAHFSADGDRTEPWTAGTHRWLPKQKADSFFERKIDDIQSSKLGTSERQLIERATSKITVQLRELAIDLRDDSSSSEV